MLYVPVNLTRLAIFRERSISSKLKLGTILVSCVLGWKKSKKSYHPDTNQRKQQ